MAHEHTLKAFDDDIDSVRSIVIAMGGLVEKQFVRAIDAVRHGDLRLASLVLSEEAQVNQMQVQADLLCNQVIAKRQPMATDLRELVGAIHVVNDLERVGDEAKKIAIRSKNIEAFAGKRELPLDRVYEMAERARSMLAASLDAMVRHDVAAAKQVLDMDRLVDEERELLGAALLQKMTGELSAAAAVLDMIFVVQSIERVGDHATNIAEFVINVVEGIDPRHAARG